MKKRGRGTVKSGMSLKIHENLYSTPSLCQKGHFDFILIPAKSNTVWTIVSTPALRDFSQVSAEQNKTMQEKKKHKQLPLPTSPPTPTPPPPQKKNPTLTKSKRTKKQKKNKKQTKKWHSWKQENAGGRNSSVGSVWARCPQRRGFDPPLGTFSGRGDFSLGVNMGSNSIPPKNSFG